MMYNEFAALTGVEVSATEYEHIEYIYIASDLEKKEFCELWKRMNPNRVKAAKEAREAAEAEDRKREKVFKIACKMDAASVECWQAVANVIGRRDIEYLQQEAGLTGIDICSPIYHARAEIRSAYNF